MEKLIANLADSVYFAATGKTFHETPVVDFFDLIAVGYIGLGIALIFIILEAATYRPRMERKFRKARR